MGCVICKYLADYSNDDEMIAYAKEELCIDIARGHPDMIWKINRLKWKYWPRKIRDKVGWWWFWRK